MSQNSSWNRGTSIRIWVTLLLVGCIYGCGGPDGPVRYEVFGKVTFTGKSVPAGKVMFEPDRSKGNKGPAGIAKIENGVYETLPGQGAVAGPLVVRIQGYDGVCPPGFAGSDFGRPIFSRYDAEIELDPKRTEIDFEVPARR